MQSWPLVLALLPGIAAVIFAIVRTPALLLAAYATVLPFGSSMMVPLGLPDEFQTVSTLAGLLASVGLVAHLAVTRRSAGRLPAPLPWWLLFLGAVTLTLAWSIAPARSLNQLVVLVSLVALYVVGVLPRFGREDLRVIEGGIGLSGALTGGYALLLLATGNMHTSGQGTPRFQIAGGGGEGGDANTTAAALILPFVVSLVCAFGDRQGAARTRFLVAAALSGAGITLTGSRGGMVGVAVAILILAANDRRRHARLAYLAIPVAVIAIVLSFAPEGTQDRYERDTTSGRDLIWSIGVDACRDHCVQGSGWHTFSPLFTEYFLDRPDTTRTRTTFNPHSIWIRVAVEGGLAATIAMLGAFGSTFRESWKLPAWRRGPPLAAFTALLVTNSFLGNLDFKYFWLVLMYVSWVASVHWHEARQDAAGALAGEASSDPGLSSVSGS